MAGNEQNIAIGALKECVTREDVEDVFSKFEINDFPVKTECLSKAMGEADMFFSNGNPTDEQKYELVLQIFLTMTWKYDD